MYRVCSKGSDIVKFLAVIWTYYDYAEYWFCRVSKREIWRHGDGEESTSKVNWKDWELHESHEEDKRWTGELGTCRSFLVKETILREQSTRAMVKTTGQCEHHKITSQLLWGFIKLHDLKTLFDSWEEDGAGVRGGEDDGPLGGGHEAVDSGHEAVVPLVKHNINLKK